MRYFIFPILSVVLFIFINCGEGSSPSNVNSLNTTSPSSSQTSPTTSTTPSVTSSPSIQSLTLEQSSPLNLTVTDEMQLSVSVVLTDGTTITNVHESTDQVPNANVLWFSNDSTIATVSQSGEIQALKAGSTTIKATLLNQSVILNLSVTNFPVTLTTLNFHQTKQTLTNNTPLQLTLDATFSDGSTLMDQNPTDLSSSSLGCNLNLTATNPQTFSVTQAGLLTPLTNGVGLAELTCGSNFFAYLPIIIQDLSSQSVNSSQETLQSLKILLPSSPLVVGQSTTLACDIVFNTGTVHAVSDTFVSPQGVSGEITWMSSSNSVVSISQGLAKSISYGSATLTASYKGVSNTYQAQVKMASQTASSFPEYFLNAQDMFTITYGTNGGYGSQLFPGIVYGMPVIGGTNVVSVGSGGKILIQLNHYIPVDGPGVDFTIFSNPVYQQPYGLFAKRAQVSVSEDGINYYKYPCNVNDPQQIYAGCAGVGIVNAQNNPLDPTVSGGDQYDLAQSGMSQIQYILIQDLNTCVPGDPTYFTNLDGYPACTTPGEEGFDLAALAIINGVNQ